MNQAKRILFSKYSIVIGLGFGDEGKGIFTDYLCSFTPNSLVVRFSGGHQSGHTVFTDDINHIFSNFGSGTLRGMPTYWSKYCTIEPVGLLKELNILKNKGISPRLFIDERCPITTPYEIFTNRENEKEKQHGSCGVGFGATIEREENHYSLTFLDLFYPKIFNNKLNILKEYYKAGGQITDFKEACNIIVNNTKIKRVYGLPYYNSYIFEGSQGLLLDQNFGFFPNVTRANTGTKNALELTDRFDKVFLITRAYQTRHGNGFMTNENITHNIKDNPLETNVKNEYQGRFRKSLLDVSLLEYAINKDKYIRYNNNNLVITCLPHIENEYRFTYENKIICCSNEVEFVNKVSDILGIKSVYLSWTNNSKNIRKYGRMVMATSC